MRYVTRPLTIEARTRLKGQTRTGSQFSASWSSTQQLLDKELSHLGVRGEFVMQIDIALEDLKLNGELRANARPASPAVAISIDRRNKPSLLFVCGKFPHWQENIRAIALGLEALRKVERYGITQAEEQYTGFGALPPGTPMPAAKMTVEDAAMFLTRHGGGTIFDLNPPQADAVRTAYRSAAARLHPDAADGDADLFRQATDARNLLLAEAVRS